MLYKIIGTLEIGAHVDKIALLLVGEGIESYHIESSLSLPLSLLCVFPFFPVIVGPAVHRI